MHTITPDIKRGLVFDGVLVSGKYTRGIEFVIESEVAGQRFF